MKGSKGEWIFYLKLGSKLPQHFFEMDQEFKLQGVSLVPISFSNLLEVTRGEDAVPVIVVVSSIAEANYYVKKLMKLIRVLLRYKRIDLFKASSFSFLNESAQLKTRDNYHFFSLPVSRTQFCDTILTRVTEKSTNVLKWPGGKTPRMSLTR